MLLDVWFGQCFDLKESSWSPGDGRPFVETDGNTMFFPALMPNQDEAVLALLHTAGHLRFGSFERSAMTRIFDEAGLHFPYGSAAPWATLFARYANNELGFRLVFDLCEDLRVDSRIHRLVPSFLQRMLASALPQEQHPETVLYYELALRSVEGALAAAASNEGGRESWFAPLLAPQATISDAWRIANGIFEEYDLPQVTDLEAFQGGYLPGRSPSMTCPVHPLQHRQQQEEIRSRPTSTPRRRDGRDERAIMLRIMVGRQKVADQQKETSEIGASSRVSTHPPQRSEGGHQHRPGTDRRLPYPEWDYREARYKRNWSWVLERDLAESNSTEANRMMSEYAATLSRLKRAIQAQKPTRPMPRMRQLEGDEIDINAAVNYVVEKAAGRAAEPAIFRRREMRQRGIAVTLLADMSTSIMQQLPDGEGRRVDRVRAGVLLFAESMEEVGDVYSIAGFCSQYRENVNYYNIKNFEEPLTMRIRSRIGGISGRLATRMGAAIRHATACFEGIESRRRLLLILSDGQPEDYDDGGDRRYLHEDTRMAVKEAVAKGVHPFCITVDEKATRYLPQIFGKGHYLVLDHINSLPKKLPEIYFRLRR